MNVKLYSTHCPRCNVLEKKLQQKGVKFELVLEFDSDDMQKKGFDSAPILQVDDEYMDFVKANNWVNEQ